MIYLFSMYIPDARKPPQRRNSDPDAFVRKAFAKLIECDVGLFGDGGQAENCARFNALRTLIAAHRLGLGIALISLERAPPPSGLTDAAH